MEIQSENGWIFRVDEHPTYFLKIEKYIRGYYKIKFSMI